ncbi:TPA: hypothetical protein ACH3X3_005921 [Trebouxia sp. C0006]
MNEVKYMCQEAQPLHSQETFSYCAHYDYIHEQTKMQKECYTHHTTVIHNMPPKSVQALLYIVKCQALTVKQAVVSVGQDDMQNLCFNPCHLYLFERVSSSICTDHSCISKGWCEHGWHRI